MVFFLFAIAARNTPACPWYAQHVLFLYMGTITYGCAWIAGVPMELCLRTLDMDFTTTSIPPAIEVKDIAGYPTSIIRDAFSAKARSRSLTQLIYTAAYKYHGSRFQFRKISSNSCFVSGNIGCLARLRSITIVCCTCSI